MFMTHLKLRSDSLLTFQMLCRNLSSPVLSSTGPGSTRLRHWGTFRLSPAICPPQSLVPRNPSSGSTPGNPNIQVTLDFGRAGSAETQTHEGTHVGDDQKFLNSFDPMTTGYNQALNPTHFETEFNAFRAGAEVSQEHGFGPNDAEKITDYINANYPARLLNMPVFNPANFPAGVPDDEQQ